MAQIHKTARTGMTQAGRIAVRLCAALLPAVATLPAEANAGGLPAFDSFPVVPAGGATNLEIATVHDDAPASRPGNPFGNAPNRVFRAVEIETR